jgi:beta-1,4-mannosyltransferase
MRRLHVEAEPAFRTRYANPYNARLYTAMTAEGVLVRDMSWFRLLATRVDIVHLHWPDLTFLSGVRQYRVVARLLFFFAFLKLARLRGTRLVWTAHNINSHEERSTPFLRAQYRKLLTRNLDAVICLSADGVAAMRAAYPELADVPAYVTPHGHYRHDYDFAITRSEARRLLGIDQDARLLVSVGQIRPYKNVPTLIEQFRARPDDGTLLGIAGNPGKGTMRAGVNAAAKADPRILMELSFLSDERMALWLRASDLVVLPYSAIQNSGSATGPCWCPTWARCTSSPNSWANTGCGCTRAPSRAQCSTMRSRGWRAGPRTRPPTSPRWSGTRSPGRRSKCTAKCWRRRGRRGWCGLPAEREPGGC